MQIPGSSLKPRKYLLNQYPKVIPIQILYRLLMRNPVMVNEAKTMHVRRVGKDAIDLKIVTT